MPTLVRLRKHIVLHYIETDTGMEDLAKLEITGGSCEPILQGIQWMAEVHGWRAIAPTRHGAALLAFMAWLDALPPELQGSSRIKFVG